MKKLSILLIGLLLVSGLAFAQEPTVTGEASLTFGYDLDTEMSGFKNAASGSIDFDWLGGDASKGTTGWITLSGWGISFDGEDEVSIDAPSIEAGFTFEPITITIYSAPEFEAGNATGFTWHEDDDPADEVEVALSANNETGAEGEYSTEGTWYMHDTVEGDADDIPDNGILIDSDTGWELYFAPDATPTNTDTPGFQGLTVTADLGVASLDLLVASDGTWEENADNSYAFGGVLTANVDPLVLNAGVFAGPTDDAFEIGFTAGVDATVGTSTIGVGFDAMIPEDTEELEYDASLLVGTGISGITLDVLTYLYQDDVDDLDLDLEFVLGANNMVDGLGFTETFQTINVMSAASPLWYSLTEVSYLVDGIMPYASFGINDESVMDVTAGVELSEMVENTVFTLEYAVEDIENNLGLITFDATISF